jgi:hypothetical protein
MAIDLYFNKAHNKKKIKSVPHKSKTIINKNFHNPKHKSTFPFPIIPHHTLLFLKCPAN